jgi:hypothetical protein
MLRTLRNFSPALRLADQGFSSLVREPERIRRRGGQGSPRSWQEYDLGGQVPADCYASGLAAAGTLSGHSYHWSA